MGQGVGKKRSSEGVVVEHPSVAAADAGTKDNTKKNFFCTQAMRDPMSIVLSFTANPSPLRQSCRFLVECYNHGVYLEGTQPYPYLTIFKNKKDASELVNLLPSSSALGEGEGGDTGEEEVVMEAVPVVLSCTPQHTGSPMVREECSPTLFNVEDYYYHLFIHRIVGLSSIADEVGNGFCHKQSSSSRWVNDHIRSVSVEGLLSLQSIGSGFLEQSYSGTLVECQVTNLPFLEVIGDKFLFSARHLKNFRLENLPALVTVGNYWLCGAHALEGVRVANLPQLETIGSSFLTKSKSLVTLTVENLPRLKSIGSAFLFGSGIPLVVIEDLPSLGFIGECMNECRCLKEVRLTNLPNLTSIGSGAAGFMNQCTSMQRLELRGLPNLTDLGQRVLLETRLSEGFTTDGDGEFNLQCQTVDIYDDCHPKVVEALRQAGGGRIVASQQ